MTELPPRGTGLFIGTARRGLERGLGRPLGPEERRERHKAIFGQLGGGLLRGLLEDYMSWFMARPKIRESIPRMSSDERAIRPALY